MEYAPSNRKRLPYGMMNFADIRFDNYYYVDKTAFIPLIEQSDRFFFFIRPRRFGKSLTLSMLQHYYDVRTRDKFDALFGDLYIGKHPTPDRNTYLVLKLNFSGISGELHNYRQGLDAHCQTMFDYFCDIYADYLPQGIKEKLDEKSGAVEQLEYLFTECNKTEQKIYLFIDEYDHFTNAILSDAESLHRYTEETHKEGYLRAFFNKVKAGTDSCIKRCFITGVSPVTMDDLTSGFNIGTNYSLSPEFNEMTGFTEKEVREMLTYYSTNSPFNHTVGQLIDIMKPWYSSEKEQKIFMSKQGTIIVVDDNKGVLSAVKLLLKNHFEHIVTLPSPITLPAALREENAQVVLLDMNFSSGLNTGNEGLYWLHEIKKIHPSLPVVLFTAYADIDLAVRGIKEGATDFIVKPWDNARLIETLLSACRNSSKNKKRAEIPKTVSSMYWGESNAMKQLRTLIEKVAQTDANILITGENGTGKEMLAREIHALSNRYRRDMITVDMGAITESLFESELFGHKKGSFTDAHTDRAGKFEAAHEGTLFLDEIGNLPYHLQSKLLTAIQSRSVVRVGSNEPIPVNIRLICATNCNLEEMVAKGKFREDLLYRINTIHIEIPPLRERKEDIIPLAERFIDRFCKQYDKGNILLSTGAQEKLRTYPWYGNIRELEHAVEKAVIINEDGILSEEHFHFPRKIAAPATETSVSTLEEMELQMIQKAIEKCNGNLSAVAAQLGITRQTLYNKMKKFGL